MKEIELFKHIKDCIGMFVPDSTYSNYLSLIIGYDLAKDNILLEGFSEWLASKYKLPHNFSFSKQIKYNHFKKDFNLGRFYYFNPLFLLKAIRVLVRKKQNLKNTLIIHYENR